MSKTWIVEPYGSDDEMEIDSSWISSSSEEKLDAMLRRVINLQKIWTSAGSIHKVEMYVEIEAAIADELFERGCL